MSSTSDEPSDLEMPTEIVVPTSWAESQLAKGLLQLSPDQIGRLAGNSTISLPIELVNPIINSKPRAPIEWIEPMDAVHRLAPKVGGDIIAKSMIAERLRDCAIECTFVWSSEGPDIGPVSAERPSYPILGPGVNIAPWVTQIKGFDAGSQMGWAFWRYSDDWEADLNRWDWRAALFVASKQVVSTLTVDGVPKQQFRSEQRARMVVSGIRFSREDIEKIAESGVVLQNQRTHKSASEDTAGRPAKRGRTGPRPKKYDLSNILGRIETEIHDGKISKIGSVLDYGMQAKLESRIIREVAEQGGSEPSEATARRRAKKLMDQWRRHEGIAN